MAKESKNVVKVREKVTVYATGKGGHYRAGDVIKAHPELAAKLVRDGKATEKAPK
jgi:2-oxo-4-hydroxy-4-carboxy--5-ureidoimidazoline (OHCU) decarboxylase